jgi:hypothetical protein
MWSLVHAGRAIFVDVGVLNGVSLNLPAPAIPAWAAYQLSKWAIAWMPLVLFLAASRSSAQQRQSGILGLALLSIVGSVVATGWAVPFVSAHYRHVAFGFINSPHRPPDFIDPWAILNLPDLLRAMQASGPLTTWELLGQLIERSSATFSGALLLLLASLISRMNGWRAWSVVVFVVAVYWWAPKPLDSFFWHGSIYPRLIGPAVIPMVALSMWFVIASCISRRTVQESSAA